MPYVKIEITDGATTEQKLELYKGVTDLLVKVLNKKPEYTFIVIEEVEGDRLRRRDPFDLAVRFEAVGALGGSQAGSAPDGFQEHAGGHLPPGIHRLAENVHRHAVPAKVRGDRQAVRAGADDGGRC